ncbi:MAG: insulinase family protein [Ignavibacteria bacterium]|nr:insulinase family protein [Ignavibacteria bacterium]
MNKILRIISHSLLLIYSLFIISGSDLYSQIKTATDGKYTYEYAENDPLNARIYTLDNGLKVYMTINKDAPRIQTYIAVAAGSKNDPHDAQGLSHYLEHMVFKGTDKFGSKDYKKEKPLIDTIIALYEQRRITNDPVERKNIYHKIDSVSFIASEYAIANEYDKMIASIGGIGTNAHTSVEETVYYCDLPSNQLEKWLTIEAERFRNPVMRLFHTELEAVYEEKNSGLDNDGSKVWEALNSGLFQKHTYGTQTTIGSVEQLQNPSIQKIIDYYNERYVPNNMAICMSGDLDFDQTIKLIDEKFGSFQKKEVPVFVPPAEAPITSPIVKEVFGPSQESVIFGYRADGAGTKNADILLLLEYILSNGSAGLIDLNLNQEQKVLGAFASTDINKDYSTIYFGGNPREGQTLDQVKNLLMSQIELLKKGEFPDWLIPAIISNFKLSRLKALDKNDDRANTFVSSFILGIDWDKFINFPGRLNSITKADVVNYEKENLNDNYVIVYKRTGEDTSIKKVEKPEINPVKINQQDKSEFVETILSEPTEDIQPVFLDFKKDIQELTLNNDIPLYYLQNKENDLYDIHYIIELGTNQNKKLNLAIDYLDYLGTSKYTPVKLKEEFYRLASSYSIGVSEDQITVSLSGLNENFKEASELFEELISDPESNEEALNNLIDDILKKREDAKLSKRTILWSGMYNYGKYGKDNPFTYRLSEEELKNIKASELIKILKDIFSYKQRVLYYGPESTSEIVSAVNKFHKTPPEFKTLPTVNKFTEQDITENVVYVVNYDMQQAEIVMLSKGESYNKNNIPIISLYNEYFGGGMGSIVFQDLRESKALAYATFSAYQTPNRKERSNYIVAYIGSQADKLPEAMAGMSELLNNIPEAEIIFNNSKNNLMKQIQSERITKSEILFSYEGSKKLGIDYDIRKDIYENIPNYSISDVLEFQKKYIKNKKYVTLVLGDVKKLDMKTLENYGKVNILTLKDVFGY